MFVHPTLLSFKLLQATILLLKVSFFCAPAAVNLRCCSNPIKAFVSHYGLTSWLTEHKEAASGHRERAQTRCYLWWCDVKALTGGIALFSLPERRLLGGNWLHVINYLFVLTWQKKEHQGGKNKGKRNNYERAQYSESASKNEIQGVRVIK